MRLHHIGWNTTDPELFEKFWVNLIGYELTFTSYLDQRRASQLFGFRSTAEIRRYSHPDYQLPEIEIHCFKRPDKAPRSFKQEGITHVCLQVEDRETFIDNLRKNKCKVNECENTSNGKCWKNYFVQDFENNWIEIRE